MLWCYRDGGSTAGARAAVAQRLLPRCSLLAAGAAPRRSRVCVRPPTGAGGASNARVVRGRRCWLQSPPRPRPRVLRPQARALFAGAAAGAAAGAVHRRGRPPQRTYPAEVSEERRWERRVMRGGRRRPAAWNSRRMSRGGAHPPRGALSLSTRGGGSFCGGWLASSSSVGRLHSGGGRSVCACVRLRIFRTTSDDV